MGNKLKLVLFGSFALNFLLVGITIGYFSRDWGRRRHHDRPPMEFTQQLPPEKAKEFSQAMESLHKRNRETRKKIRKLQREVVDVLTAPKFDAKTYQEKMKELHKLHGQMRGELTQTVMEMASTLNQQERKALAALIEKGPPHRRGKDRHPGRKHDRRGGRGGHFGPPPPGHHPPGGNRSGPPGGPPPHWDRPSSENPDMDRPGLPGPPQAEGNPEAPPQL